MKTRPPWWGIELDDVFMPAIWVAMFVSFFCYGKHVEKKSALSAAGSGTPPPRFELVEEPYAGIAGLEWARATRLLGVAPDTLPPLFWDHAPPESVTAYIATSKRGNNVTGIGISSQRRSVPAFVSSFRHEVAHLLSGAPDHGAKFHAALGTLRDADLAEPAPNCTLTEGLMDGGSVDLQARGGRAAARRPLRKE